MAEFYSIDNILVSPNDHLRPFREQQRATKVLIIQHAHNSYVSYLPLEIMRKTKILDPPRLDILKVQFTSKKIDTPQKLEVMTKLIYVCCEIDY